MSSAAQSPPVVLQVLCLLQRHIRHRHRHLRVRQSDAEPDLAVCRKRNTRRSASYFFSSCCSLLLSVTGGLRIEDARKRKASPTPLFCLFVKHLDGFRTYLLQAETKAF